MAFTPNHNVSDLQRFRLMLVISLKESESEFTFVPKSDGIIGLHNDGSGFHCFQVAVIRNERLSKQQKTLNIEL